jgi:hypothetical protein
MKDNLNALDFRSLLPDVMTVADDVDAQVDGDNRKLHEIHEVDRWEQTEPPLV